MAISTSRQTDLSGLDNFIRHSDNKAYSPLDLQHLALTILYNLEHQHDWTFLSIHTHSPQSGLPLPRPILSGLPPRRIYVHPDEQAEILKAEHDTGIPVLQHPEREWVLPTHITENWTIQRFAELFDTIDTIPPSDEGMEDFEAGSQVGKEWRGTARQKRVLLATLHNDSTVVYYIVHDGIVKPRQN